MVLVLKIKFGEDTRRLTVESAPTFAQLVVLLKQLFPNLREPFQVKYEDEDKDLIYAICVQLCRSILIRREKRHFNCLQGRCDCYGQLSHPDHHQGPRFPGRSFRARNELLWTHGRWHCWCHGRALLGQTQLKTKIKNSKSRMPTSILNQWMTGSAERLPLHLLILLACKHLQFGKLATFTNPFTLDTRRSWG